MCGLVIVAVGSVALAPLAWAQGDNVPRTPSGRPDLSGTYDISTLTPRERPAELGEKMFLTDEEAAEIAAGEQDLRARTNSASDPNRDAPPAGGDGSLGAAGNVGGYNRFWLDRGTGAFQIDGQWRTSILIDPPDGRYPSLTEAAAARREARLGARERPQNDGTAYSLEAGLNAPGPYDNMEQRPFAERCILGFSSTAGPPTLLNYFYNNHKRIVQTEDVILINIEMNHEARVIRMNAEHDPPEIRKWLGDSIGHWEGDTLVVETTNFPDRPSFTQGSRNMTVVERFSVIDRDTLLYNFTVTDRTVWTAPFTGEYVWPRSDNKMFEYACHEANYALEGIMKGARLLEAEFRGEEPEGIPNPVR